MKFVKLFKKELKELITVQALIGAVAMVFMFVLLGNVMSSVEESFSKSNTIVAINDQDQSEWSKGAIDFIQKNQYDVVMVEGSTPVEYLQDAKAKNDNSTVLVFPAGFGASIDNSQPANVEIISELTSFAMSSDNDNSASNAKKLVSTYIISESVDNSVEFITNPVNTISTTVVGEKHEQGDIHALKSFGMQQSIFIPVIIFMLIMTATQLNCAAIANEKNDKTLETLLSTPVSRLDVIASKMCASAVFSLLMAGVFIGGFSFYMNGITGDMVGDATSTVTSLSTTLETLGIKLNAMHFALLGIQLFLTIAIALTISMILGALAKDLKATQGLITPLIFATLIPYMVTILTDVNTLPMFAKSLLYAIPFTHTFTATGNVLFGYTGIFYFGIFYQALWLVGVVWVAIKVFSSDKIFTMTLEFKKKSKSKPRISKV